MDGSLGEEEEEFSLEDLGAAYARAMAESGLLPEPPPEAEADDSEADQGDADRGDAAILSEAAPGRPTAGGAAAEDADELAISPTAIVEAALFIGHPDSRPLTAAQIAATMRGVSADEVEQIVDELNAGYEQNGHAFWIERRDGGLWMGVRDSLRSVRSAFYGKYRETRLTQGAIDVLALVAYQPGVTAAKISDQRGKDCGPIVNQMVRRELLEMRREPQGEGKPVPKFYPTTRLLNLLGLRSLDDLPQVDETDIAPRG